MINKGDPHAPLRGVIGQRAMHQKGVMDGTFAGLQLDRAPVVATSLGGYFTVRAAAARPIPILGSCFGHQLVVRALAVALRVGKGRKLDWDGPNMRAKNQRLDRAPGGWSR